MDAKKMGKLKMHLQAAMDCLDEYGGEEGSEGTAPEGDDDDLPMKSMKMSLMKYKD